MLSLVRVHFLFQGSREQANQRCSVGPAMGRATWPCSDNQILPEDIPGKTNRFCCWVVVIESIYAFLNSRERPRVWTSAAVHNNCALHGDGGDPSPWTRAGPRGSMRDRVTWERVTWERVTWESLRKSKATYERKTDVTKHDVSTSLQRIVIDGSDVW